jgi:predicted DCC family thiol-disulfide oxidoreductase YuxK
MHASTAPGTDHQPRDEAEYAVLLYDGTCGLCARSVQFVLRHERASRALRFATLQGRYGERAFAAHPSLAGVDSVIWLEPSTGGHDRVRFQSDAVIAVLEHLGGGWRWLARIGRMVPGGARDALYRVVARYRYRIFGRDQSCLLPVAEQRARFLD